MRVEKLIAQLLQTGMNNEVQIESKKTDWTGKLYLSFDDIGDVTIYEVED